MVASQGYSSVSRRALDIEDYIDIARRHMVWIVGPAFAGLVVSIVVAFLLPNTYDSSAMMQITPAQVSESLVQSTLSQQMSDRIVQMENSILSRSSLSTIIQDPRLKLYEQDQKTQPLEDIIEKMRGNIHISVSSGDAGRRATAFSIGFSYSDRIKAQQTVQALITKFSDANQEAQRNQQDIVKSLFHDTVTEAKANLDRLSDDLAQFEKDNADKLPSHVSTTIAQNTTNDNLMSGTVQALNQLEVRRMGYNQQIAGLQSRLQLMDSFNQNPDAPEVKVVAKQNADILAMDKYIDNLKFDLEMQRKVYKDAHPAIKTRVMQLASYEKKRDEMQKQLEEDQRRQAEAEASRPKQPDKKAPNFQEAATRQEFLGQIANFKQMLALADRDEERIKAEQDKYKKNSDIFAETLKASPDIAAKFEDLLRSKENAEKTYQEQFAKQQIADQNSQLIQRKAGEQLDVLDPPSLPQKPSKPNRWFIVGSGFAISLFLGVAMAGVQEAKDTSLKNLKDVRAYTNLPVLCSVPLLENTLLVRRKRRLTYLAWSAAVVVGAVAVAASVFYYLSITKAG